MLSKLWCIILLASALSCTGVAQVVPSGPPVNIEQQAVLDAQKVVYDHILGSGNWSEAEFSLGLDAVITSSGVWTTATSSTISAVLLFHMKVYVDLELDDPLDETIPGGIWAFIEQNGYRAGVVFGNAYGPGGGTAPIGFGGYVYQYIDSTGQVASRLLITLALTQQELDSLEEWDYFYRESIAEFGDLTTESGGDDPTPTILAWLYCGGASPPADADFDACVIQANLNYQCQWKKLRARMRLSVIGGGTLVAACLLMPATCLPGAGLIGGAIFCLSVAAADTKIDHQFAIACCCNALSCRAAGGTGCPSVIDCNPSGCTVPLCGR